MKQPEFECPCGGMFVIVRSYEKFNVLECKICRGLARYDGEKLEAVCAHDVQFSESVERSDF